MSKFFSILFSLLFLSVFICGFPSPLAAQCPPKTTVADTLYNADGSLAAGRVVIAWPTYAIGSCQVVAGQATVSVTAGAFSVQLYPNDAAVPAGTSYRVTYYLKSGSITTEYWVVPTSTPPVAIAVVRSATVPVPNVMFSQAQVTNLVPTLATKVELPVPCASGKFLQSNGSSTQPQVACVDGTGGSGGGSQHQVNGTNLVANDPVNFPDSSTIAVTNPSAGNVQAAVKDASITAAKLAVSGPGAAQLSGVGDTNITASALSPNRIAGTAEVLTNKGAVSGYAALDASTKVVQDPANVQAAPAAAKIPLADGAGKIADGWLSANVSLLGSAIDLASEVTGTLPESHGGTNQSTYATGDLLHASAANTLSKLTAGASGRYLRMGASVPAWSSVAAAGAGGCSANLFVTANNDNAAPTCTQPAFSNLSGAIASAQQNNPAAGAKGGIEAKTCSSTDKLSAIGTDGIPVCSADQSGGGSSHNLLSATHSDTTPASVARGAIVTGQGATSAWALLAHPGNANRFLRANTNEPGWAQVDLATADVAGILPGANGGTGNSFFAVSGPATSLKTFTFPNASATVLTDTAAVTPAQGGTGANNTATTGRVLRGNGTNFVTSALSHSGIGACTNQFWRTGNDDAAPTCASVAGTDFANQNANLFLAGPTSGSAAAPTFRVIDQADINTVALLTPWNKRFLLGIANGGTALNVVGADNQAITTGTGSSVAPTDGLGQTANCATGTTSGNDCIFSGNIVWRRDTDANQRTNLKARWRGSIQETTLTRWWAGFTDQTGTTMAGADNPAGNYAAFRFSTPAAETTFKCVTKNNTTQNVVDSTVTVTAGQSYEFRIEFDDVGGTVSFYIDGTSRCSSPISSNLPLNGTNMRFGPIMAETETTAARNYRVTWLLVLSDI